MRTSSKWTGMSLAFLLCSAGCTMIPNAPNSQAQQATDLARREQLLAVAEKYEKAGRKDAAERIHAYVAQNFPDASAGQRANVPAKIEPVIARAGAPATEKKTPPAVAEPVQKAIVESKPQSREDLAAEIRQRNQVALRKIMEESSVANASPVSPPKNDQSTDDAPFVKVKAEPKITTVAVSQAAEFPAALHHADGQSQPDQPNWAIDAPAARPANPEAAAAYASPIPGHLMASMCEDLPAELLPAILQLSDDSAATRVSGLVDLCARGKAAAPAAPAVHAMLQDKDPIVAVYAAGTLHRLTGDTWDALRVLTAQLDHKDDRVVRLSSYLLGEMGPAGMAAAPRLEALRDSNSGLNSLHAAEALTRIAPDDYSSVSVLNHALQDKQASARWFAAVSLGAVTGPCVEDACLALVAALHDSDVEVRKAACLSLGGMGSSAKFAVPELQSLAANDTSDVRAAAETVLRCLQ